MTTIKMVTSALMLIPILTIAANATEKLDYSDLTSYQPYYKTVMVENDGETIVGFDKFNVPTFEFKTHGIFRMEGTCRGFNKDLEGSTIKSLKSLVNMRIFNTVNGVQIVPCGAIYTIK